MSEPLRVLLVEDSADDAELILHELKREGFELFASRVETAVAMKEALDNGEWGVILSDFNMPNFSGEDALGLLRARGQDIPFIIVSGKIGEETAVAMMKAGAHDYIMKDNLKRLFPAVRRELQEAAVRKERRQAEAALKESEEKYAALVEQGNDGIIIIRDGRVEFVTKRMSGITGLPVDEAIGKPFIDFVAPADREMVADRYRRRVRGEVVSNNYEINITGENGKIIPVEVNASRINYHGNLADMAILRDITQRKKAAAQIESLAKFPDENPNPVMRVTFDNVVVYANSAGNYLLTRWGGHADENGVRRLPESIWQIACETITRGERTEIDVPVGEFIFSVLFVPIKNENYLNIYGRDITEREKAEEALKASEEKFRALFENAPVGIAVTHADGSSIIRNAFNQKMHGYDSKEEFMKLKSDELYYDIDDRKRWIELLEKGQVKDFEVQHKRKDGSIFWVSLTAIQQTNGSGDKQFILITQDITERKQMAEALRASEEKYRTMVENLPVGITISTIDGRTIERNKASLKMHGYISEEEFNRVPITDIYFDIEDRKRLLGNLTRGTVHDFETRHKRKDGSVFWISMTAIPQIGENDEKQILVVSQDIDERKQAEEALKASEEKYRLMVETLPVGIAFTTFDGRPIERNRASMEMHGYNLVEEYVKVPPASLYSDSKDRDRFMEALKKGIVRNYEVKHKRKDGSTFWMSMTGIPQTGENGEKRMLVVSQDIDERKRAQEITLQSERRYRDLFDAMSSGVAVYKASEDGEDFIFEEFNRAGERIEKIERQNVIGKSILSIFPGANNFGLFEVLQRVWRTGAPEHFPASFYRDDRITGWRENYVYKLSSGEIVAVYDDVTAQKQAEEALQASEEKFRTLVENAPIGITINSLDGHTITRNRASMEIHGYTSAEDFGKLPAVALYADPADRDRLVEKIAKGPVRNFETKHKRQDGSLFWISITAIPQTGENGEKRMLVVSQDIDERKRAEEALRASEEKFRSLVENAPVGIGITTLDGRPLFRNKTVAQMHGFKDVEDLMANPVTTHYYDEEDRKRFLELSRQGMVTDFEVQMKKKDGTPLWMSLTAIPQITGAGEKQFITIMLDINDRKKAEAALKASEEKFRSLVENAPIGITVTTPGGKRLEANKAIVEMHRCESKEEYLRASVNDVYFKPEERNNLMKMLENGPVQNYEMRRKRRDGSVFWAWLSSIPYVNAAGETLLINVIQDISVRKGVEEALRESEQRFRSLVENLPVGIGVSMMDGRSVQRNKALMEMYGFTDRQEFNNSSTPGRYYDIKDSARFTELAEKGPVKGFEVRLKRRDGTVFWASFNAIKQAAPSGEKLFLTVIEDIDDKKKAEAENELKALLLDSAADMIYVQDLTGKIIYANDATCKSHGFSKDEFATMEIRDLLPSERMDAVSQRTDEVIKKGELRFETEHSCKDGSKIQLEVYNRLITIGDSHAIISVARDISERRKMQEQLIIADRLASIGELASGVAHEVNNPLTSVLGFSELLLEQPLSDAVKADLTTIRDEAQRAAGVVKNLLTFARKQAPAKQRIQVNDIINKTLDLRAYEQKTGNIHVITHLSSELPDVMADPSQLQQVFFNLMTNAEYFMGAAHNRGVLTIATECADGIVRASVTDDGPGITPESLAHLFTPFFTTKPVGKGTGLGLSICHGIIAAHEGKMYAKSVPGTGATFVIELPAISE